MRLRIAFLLAGVTVLALILIAVFITRYGP